MVGEGAESLSAVRGNDAGIGGVYFQIAWLQAYVAAASFGMFLANRAGRRGFRLPWPAGCASRSPHGHCGRRTPSPVAARIAALLTALSVPFIICSRQARYYALAAAITCSSRAPTLH